MQHLIHPITWTGLKLGGRQNFPKKLVSAHIMYGMRRFGGQGLRTIPQVDFPPLHPISPQFLIVDRSVDVKFSCSDCDFQTEIIQSLKRHKQSVHDDINYDHKLSVHECITYYCDTCDS